MRKADYGVGTNDCGLSIFINDTVANVITEKQGLASDSVRCITQCADGNYYVGTAGALSIVTLAGGLNVKKDDGRYCVCKKYGCRCKWNGCNGNR